MRFLLATALALLSASALAEPIPQPDAAPISANIEKRADNWCRVTTSLYCRKGPGRNYAKVTVEGRDTISPDKNFGVRCTREGEDINGDRTWDWIPGWGCWVSAYYTRTAGPQRYCETGLGTC